MHLILRLVVLNALEHKVESCQEKVPRDKHSQEALLSSVVLIKLYRRLCPRVHLYLYALDDETS